MLSALDMRPQAPKLNLNELLFPAFNTLVPSMYENVLPHLSKVKVSGQDVEVVVGTFHSMLSFAFKTQIFDRVLWKRITNRNFKNADIEVRRENSDQIYVEGASHDEAEDGALILPQRLKFSAKTNFLKERVKQVQAQTMHEMKAKSDLIKVSGASQESRSYLPVLPLYQLFDEHAHQLIMVDFLKQLLQPQLSQVPRPKKQKDSKSS